MKKVGDYLEFHFIKGPREGIRIAANFLIFFYHFFSIGLLARTLFSPWKRIHVAKRTSGFRPDEWFNRITYNVISRIIGALIRTLTIFIGLFALVLAWLAGSLVVALWIVLPVVTLPIYLVSGWRTGKRGERKKRHRLTAFLKFRFAGTPLAKVAVEDKEAVTAWFERIQKAKSEDVRFWELPCLLAIPGIGKDWAAGFTLSLDRYTLDLAAPKYYSSHLVGRRKETKIIERVLVGTQKRGCLLVGEPGVGKQTIVENFAKKSREGKTIPALEQKRVLLLHLDSLLGESKTKQEAKKQVLDILQEAGRAGNTILVIDHFDRFISTAEERTDLTPMFVQAMEEDNLALIGLTTPDNFAKFIYPNKKILEYFEKIEVEAPSADEALIILQDILPLFEKKTGVYATFPALKEIIEQSAHWVVDIPFPEKAIELLDDCLSYVANNLKARYLQPEHVRSVLAEKTKIPLRQMSLDEKHLLSNIEDVLHCRVINQDQAIMEIAKALRRRKTGVAAGQRPIGTFLFLGPTGVGKTETAKALAETLFGSEAKMIRLDMAQFQGTRAVDKLIGSFERKEPGILTSAVRRQPYAVLLLDEIEKAAIEMHNLFLTATDEGYLTDAFGHRVNFENLLIIGTSNAGAEYIRERIQQGITPEKLSTELVDFCLRQGLFSPEFINRFDAVVVYRPLGHEELVQIARLQLALLNKRLKEQKISLEITDDLVEKIARLGFDPTFGARPMKRVIADKVEDVIAKRILKGEVKKGEKIKIEIKSP